jgi:aerobic carbon-monoxide dehydrogenase small subunit
VSITGGRDEVSGSPAAGPGPGGEFVDDDRLAFLVNGRACTLDDVPITASLLDVLRDRLGLVGTKDACLQGRCGSCSVLLDGRLVAACLVLGVDAAGCGVTTIEGLADAEGADGLTAVQQALLDAGAVQCGFCTPGMVVAVHALLRDHPESTPLEVAEELSGNFCRCTGYGRILEAVARVREASAADEAPGEEPPHG